LFNAGLKKFKTDDFSDYFPFDRNAGDNLITPISRADEIAGILTESKMKTERVFPATFRWDKKSNCPL